MAALGTERQKVFSEEKYERISDVFETALAKEGATPPFSGNLEDPVYTGILDGLREFKTEEFPDPLN